MNVLIVDDNATNRKLLRVGLEAEGFTAVEAADGLEALDCLKGQSFDGIISDILMPRMDGFRLCQEVRRSDQFGRLPFIIYTSTYTSPGDEKLALETGADKYLRKPCAIEVMLQALREASVASREQGVQPQSPNEELVVMQVYNQTLVRKLEEKNGELAYAAARLDGIIASAMDAIICFDPDYRTRLFNPAAERMFGVPAAEVLGQHVNRFIPGRFHGNHRRHMDKFSRTNTVSSPMRGAETVTGLRANGEEFPIEASISQIDVRGQKLFTVILRDISERQKAEAEVEASRVQLRALLARMNRLREEEGARISREVHDVLGQLLTGLKMDLDWCERRFKAIPNSGLSRQLADKLTAASKLTDSMVGTVQKISRELRPSLLDHVGLEAAIQSEAREFQLRTGIRCEVLVPADGLCMEREQTTGMFRVFQEMMTNVARHAQATRVSVTLSQTDGGLILEVKDNGRGIRTAELSDSRSLGLLGMKERAALMGGRLELRSESGQGTTARLILPLPKA